MAPLLLLTLPLLSFAYTPEELQKRYQAVKAAQAEATLADSELPPCEGLDRISAEVLKHEPPASCPKARELFGQTEKFDLAARNNCRDLTRWMDEHLRDPHFARGYSPDQANKIKTELGDFRRNLEKENELLLDSRPGDDPDWTNLDENGGQGEFARMECSLPVSMDLQLAHWEMSLAEKNYGFADTTIDQVLNNDHPQEAADDYLLLLDGGWKAFENR
jgi:hypothetical protein